MNLICGDSLKIMEGFPDNHFDLIFVDPPYFINPKDKVLKRADNTIYEGIAGKNWDIFDSYESYKEFTEKWLLLCKRILKQNGSIFCCGTFQNIHLIGYLLRELNYWVKGNIIWVKKHPAPNFMAVRLCSSHEQIIWTTKNKKSKNTFNYQTLKNLNNGKQMKDVWILDSLSKKEIIYKNEKRLHIAQKPESILKRIILGMSNEGDWILDPFMGVGTTAIICKIHNRNFVGIEQNPIYVEAARNRLISTKEELF